MPSTVVPAVLETSTMVWVVLMSGVKRQVPCKRHTYLTFLMAYLKPIGVMQIPAVLLRSVPSEPTIVEQVDHAHATPPSDSPPYTLAGAPQCWHICRHREQGSSTICLTFLYQPRTFSPMFMHVQPAMVLPHHMSPTDSLVSRLPRANPSTYTFQLLSKSDMRYTTQLAF